MGEIKKHEREHCAAVSEFITTYYSNPEGSIDKRSNGPEYYEWRLGDNVFGDSLTYTYWEDGKVLGLSTATAVPLRIRGERVIGYQYHDGFVAPQLRGKGAFGKITDPVFRDFYECKSEIMYGMGPSSSLEPVLTGKYGMYVGPKYCQVFSPLRTHDLLHAKGARNYLFLGNLSSVLTSRLFLPLNISISEVEDIDPEEFPEPAEDIDFAIDRDRQWVRFRYIDCPEEYHFFVARNHRFRAGIVVKFVEWRNLRLCYLMDIFGYHEKEQSTRFILQALLKIGAEYACALVSVELHDVNGEALKMARHGYVVQRREECIVVLQNRWPFLHPSSREYDSRRWNFVSLDADYM